MFPIPWNFPFRKKNGDVTTIGEMVDSGGGGGSELPPHTVDDAGKVLSVDTEGALSWSKSLKIDKYSESNLSKTFPDDGFIIIINHGDTTNAHVTINIPNETTKTFDINNTTNSPIAFPVVANTTIAFTNDGGARNSVYYYH